MKAMRRWFNRGLRSQMPALACFMVLVTGFAAAFDYPLEPEVVEEACSLGRSSNHEELTNFLKPYTHVFEYPVDHPIAYVQSVEFETPYEQIVLKSMRAAQYDKFKAAEDYQAGHGAVFVRVVVALRMNYSGPEPAANGFQVSVSQKKPLDPATMTTRVLCNPYSVTDWGVCSVYTREILLRFDHHEFGPGKVTVTVLLPEDKSAETKFDLDRLR